MKKNAWLGGNNSLEIPEKIIWLPQALNYFDTYFGITKSQCENQVLIELYLQQVCQQENALVNNQSDLLQLTIQQNHLQCAEWLLTKVPTLILDHAWLDDIEKAILLEDNHICKILT